MSDKQLIVTDTYNHKIKILSISENKITTLAGTTSGFRDGGFSEAQFCEPSGAFVYNNKVYVADTNNWAIRILDLAKKSVSTLPLKNVPQAKFENKLENCEGDRCNSM